MRKKPRAAAPRPEPASLGPLGFGRCTCGQWAIVKVQGGPVCGVCLPDVLARARREYEELRRQLADFYR